MMEPAGKFTPVTGVTHAMQFRNAGYVPVRMCTYFGQELHDWANEHIGGENYSWTGSTFWFNNTEDATRFALRWA